MEERIILEPGRSISGNAGILLTKVEYIKDDFLIVCLLYTSDAADE